MTNIRGIKETILMTRKEKGLTQKDMAKKLNISQPAYSYYEKGDKPLPANQLKKVLEILDIEMEQLKELEDPLDTINRSLERIANALEKIEKKL
ncbi:helix-turn-helix transcriptional regulator [Acidaminobacter sp. JC074]|uniref:helix-turn-helix domain-containing protein n=1 Tax=Acidaminobacter sp. JC074 TaxID=2530199 RepID=UPI001F0FD466|nr:helix-turn-helix transcriptional regulator [Acidaminobacter sp. JC074]MCH4887162.1 helix-turn-helix transcriptional regulator [Acidaminobacter sp. JC074]